MHTPWAPALMPAANQRRALRLPILLPARLTWKDQRGADKFASVVTRDVSAVGVFVESPIPLSLSLFRLVHVQLERDARTTRGVPEALRAGRVLAAVYRVHQPARLGGRQGLALRLVVEPVRGEAHPRLPLVSARALCTTDGVLAALS